MIGWHWDQKNIGNAKCYWKGWRYIKDATGPQDVAKIVTRYVNSPCVWRQGLRAQRNFVMGLWVGIDIDEGMTLEQGLEYFSSYIHVIGTTRSHQVAKGHKPACDRFRVFLKLNRYCKDGEEYKATLSKIADAVGADRTCVDTARIFWPCREIISINQAGRLVRVVKVDPQIAEKRREKIEKTASKYHRKIVPWIADLLKHPPAEGSRIGRNATAFRISLWLYRCGWQEQEIFDLVWNSAIPIAQDSKREREIWKAVRSAARAARDQA